eukprot:UN25825
MGKQIAILPRNSTNVQMMKLLKETFDPVLNDFQTRDYFDKVSGCNSVAIQKYLAKPLLYKNENSTYGYI